jgi:hypothetical protein
MSATAPGQIDYSDRDPKEIPNALLAGHTYTILQVKDVYSHKLIKLRNVWGYFQWDGAWGKKSAFWTPDIKEILKPSLEQDDGTFWMSYEDFVKHFSGLNVCKVKSCNEMRLKGKFVRTDEETVVSKWFYCIDVKKKMNINLGLH